MSKVLFENYCFFWRWGEKVHGLISKGVFFESVECRKTMPRRREQVEVCLGTEGNKEDGYSWRKYGQKDILGAKFPR